MKRLLSVLPLALLLCLRLNAQVNVTATAGTAGPTTYPTVKAAFDAVNAGTHQGAVTLSITGNTTETASAVLNETGNGSSSFTSVLIKPAANVTPVVTGSLSGAPVIKISRASYVTIDGSNNGSTSRDLRIVNTSASASYGILIGSSSNLADSFVTVKNCIITGSTYASGIGIALGNNGSSGGTVGSGGYFNNISLLNDSISSFHYGIYAFAITGSGNGAGLNFSNNKLYGSGANALGTCGIYLRGTAGAQVNGNTIGNFNTTVGQTDVGIQLAAAAVNTTVSGNTIANIGYSASGSYGAYGIDIESATLSANILIADNNISGISSGGTVMAAGIYQGNTAISGITMERNKVSFIRNTNGGSNGPAAGIYLASTQSNSNTTLRNNYVWDVAANGNSTGFTSSTSNGNGIVIDRGGGYNLFFNTVVLNTNPANNTATHRASALLVTSNITTSNSAASSIRNNLFINLQAFPNLNSCYAVSSRGDTAIVNFDYNDYYSASGNLFSQGGATTTWTSLADVRSYMGRNDSSINVLPVFTNNSSDHHLVITANTGIANKGISIAGITTDYDLDPRATPRPDMGADEMILCNIAITTQPIADTACAGENAAFTVASTPAGNSYQWQLNTGSGFADVTNGGVYSGAITASLSITGATTLMDGYAYRCVVTAPAAVCSLNSAQALLRVNALPVASITAAGALAFCAGDSVLLTAAPGTGHTYQWKLNTTNIPGATTGSYYATTAGSYTVLVSNAATSCAATSAATVVNTAAVAITQQPAGSNICPGGNTAFSILATGAANYQWQVNTGAGFANVANGGVYSGATTATLSLTGATAAMNGFIYRCVVSDAANICSRTSASATLTISAAVTPGVTIAALPSGSICSGTAVTFTATPVGGGLTPAYQWFRNSAPVGTSQPTFTSNTLANGDIITVQLTSSVSCATVPTATSAGITMTVNSTPAMPGSITGQAAICSGTSQTYSVTAVAGATSYTWTLPSGWSGSSTTNSITTTAGTASGNVTVTATNTCGTSAAQSLAVAVTSAPAQPGTITGTAAVCGGTSQTYTVPVVAGATSYTWTLPSGWAGSAASNSITTTAGTTGGTISVTATNGCGTSPVRTLSVSVTNIPAQPATITGPLAVCAGASASYSIAAVTGATAYNWTTPGGWTGTSATNTLSAVAGAAGGNITVNAANTCGSSASQSLAVTVNPILTPSLSITTSVSGSICAGSSVTFTATPLNGGTTPVYQWKVNGINTGASLPTFTSTTLVNGDVISCVLTSNLPCPSSATSTSNSIAMVVNPNLTPAITISTPVVLPVCGSTAVTFTAVSLNGGTAPTYQWKKNGVNVGTGGTTYTSNSWINGDIITCVVTSNAGCLAQPTGTSAPFTMAVTAPATPAVTIASAGGTTICSGIANTFTATGINAGPTGTYQWQRNGTPIASGPTFTPAYLTNGDVITCILSSSLTCVTASSANSNTLTMTVQSSIVPGININSIPPAVNCEGVNLTFTTNTTGAGSNPTYNWLRNGNSTGITTPVYSSSTLSNADAITCVLTSSALCATTPQTTSNAIVVNLQSTAAPTAGIAANPGTNLVSGQPVTFTATLANAGTSPTLEWMRNGVAVATGSSYTTTTLVSGDQIQLRVLGSNLCSPAIFSYSNTLVMKGGTGISNTITTTNGIRLYPNPNKGQFTIEGEGRGNERLQLSIVNTLGQEVYNTELAPGARKWSLPIWLSEAMPDGMYLLRVKSSDVSETLPFIINR